IPRWRVERSARSEGGDASPLHRAAAGSGYSWAGVGYARPEGRWSGGAGDFFARIRPHRFHRHLDVDRSRAGHLDDPPLQPHVRPARTQPYAVAPADRQRPGRFRGGRVAAVATVYLNGEFLDRGQARLPLDDRGFLFGDGVYEVSRVVRGSVFMAEAHWERLTMGLRALSISV